MGNIANLSGADAPTLDYRTYLFDTAGRVSRTEVWRTYADYVAGGPYAIDGSSVHTNKIERIDYAFDNICRLITTTFTFGRNINSTDASEVIRKTITSTMSYDDPAFAFHIKTRNTVAV